LRGGYQALDDRSAKEGFALLSGVMPHTYNLKTTPFVLKDLTDLESGLTSGGAITMTTKKNTDLTGTEIMCPDPGKYLLNPMTKNLIEDHVYVAYNLAGGIVKLHNPHGSQHPLDLDLAAVNEFIALVDYLPKK
jgi:hypothetical protein